MSSNSFTGAPLSLLKHPISVFILSTIAIIAATGIFKEVISKPLLHTLSNSQIVIRTITAFWGSIVMVITYFFLKTKYEKKSFSDFALSNAFSDSLIGLILGFVSIGITILLLHLLGYYQFIRIISLPKFVPTIAFIFGAAILEEIIFRGLLYRLIYSWKGPIMALFISSIIFQIPHFMNSHTGLLPAILGVLFGLVVGLMYAYTDRLWMPITFHFGWNVLQPAFGTTLSGVSEFTILSEAILDGPALFIGNQFGIEVSIFSFISLVLIGSYFFIKLYRSSYFK